MDMIEKLGKIIENYEGGKSEDDCKKDINDMGVDKFNCAILIDMFDEYVDNKAKGLI